MSSIRRIAVWNTAFLGDAVLTLPLLRNLRAAYPEADIDFWVSKGIEGLFTAQPELSAVYGYNKHAGLGAMKEVAATLRGKHYDLFVSAHTSMRTALLACASGAKIRVGYNKPWYNTLCYGKHISRKFGELDEIERLAQLLIPLQLPAQYDWPELVLPATSYSAADEFFAARTTLRGARPIIGVHPGSVWGTKRWPVEYYAKLTSLAVEHGVDVCVFGGPKEEKFAAEVTRQSGAASAEMLNLSEQKGNWRDVMNVDSPVCNLAGRVNLTELAAFLGKLNCYVTNDSGPMHLAWAQRTPVCALFGPTVRELGFYPRGEGSSVLETNIDCRPCGLHGPQECPKGHHKCMRDITPQAVWDCVATKIFSQT